MTQALKPCKCGSEFVEVQVNDIGNCYVVCRWCKARSDEANCETKRGAIERWNRRATEGSAEPVAQVRRSAVWNMPTLELLPNANTKPIPDGTKLFTAPPADESRRLMSRTESLFAGIKRAGWITNVAYLNEINMLVSDIKDHLARSGK